MNKLPDDVVKYTIFKYLTIKEIMNFFPNKMLSKLSQNNNIFVNYNSIFKKFEEESLYDDEIPDLYVLYGIRKKQNIYCDIKTFGCLRLIKYIRVQYFLPFIDIHNIFIEAYDKGYINIIEYLHNARPLKNYIDVIDMAKNILKYIDYEKPNSLDMIKFLIKRYSETYNNFKCFSSINRSFDLGIKDDRFPDKYDDNVVNNNNFILSNDRLRYIFLVLAIEYIYSLDFDVYSFVCDQILDVFNDNDEGKKNRRISVITKKDYDLMYMYNKGIELARYCLSLCSYKEKNKIRQFLFSKIVSYRSYKSSKLDRKILKDLQFDYTFYITAHLTQKIINKQFCINNNTCTKKYNNYTFDNNLYLFRENEKTIYQSIFEHGINKEFDNYSEDDYMITKDFNINKCIKLTSSYNKTINMHITAKNINEHIIEWMINTDIKHPRIIGNVTYSHPFSYLKKVNNSYDIVHGRCCDNKITRTILKLLSIDEKDFKKIYTNDNSVMYYFSGLIYCLVKLSNIDEISNDILIKLKPIKMHIQAKTCNYGRYLYCSIATDCSHNYIFPLSMTENKNYKAIVSDNIVTRGFLKLIAEDEYFMKFGVLEKYTTQYRAIFVKCLYKLYD